MKPVDRKDVQKLRSDPLAFATMMDNADLEHVIEQFVSVLIKRKPTRGGQN